MRSPVHTGNGWGSLFIVSVVGIFKPSFKLIAAMVPEM